MANNIIIAVCFLLAIVCLIIGIFFNASNLIFALMLAVMGIVFYNEDKELEK